MGNGLPRPLNASERRLMSSILAGGWPGAPQLRMQLDAAQVVAAWPPEGSPSFDMAVPGEVPVAAVEDGPLPVKAIVLDGRGEYAGELIVWISGGRLAALEYAWVTDEMPGRPPEVEMLRVRPK